MNIMVTVSVCQESAAAAVGNQIERVDEDAMATAAHCGISGSGAEADVVATVEASLITASPSSSLAAVVR